MDGEQVAVTTRIIHDVSRIGREQNAELEALPVLQAEGEALRDALAEQTSGREQDIQLRDETIAALTSKVCGKPCVASCYSWAAATTPR